MTNFRTLYRYLTHHSACDLQIQKIVRSIPPQRQTLFFSATWPREVKAIASQFVQNRTVHVFVGGVEEKLMANKAIKQVLFSPPPPHTLLLSSFLLPSPPPFHSFSPRSPFCQEVLSFG